MSFYNICLSATDSGILNTLINPKYDNIYKSIDAIVTDINKNPRNIYLDEEIINQLHEIKKVMINLDTKAIEKQDYSDVLIKLTNLINTIPTDEPFIDDTESIVLGRLKNIIHYINLYIGKREAIKYHRNIHIDVLSSGSKFSRN